MPRIVLIPGFTQPASLWDRVREELIEEWDVIAADIPVTPDIPTAASELVKRYGTAFYVGYSLGGRIALQLALDHPDQVEGLVLTSTSPGIRSETERAVRSDSDRALAERISQIGVPAFIEEWLAQPLFATLDADLAGSEGRATMPADLLIHQLHAYGQGTMEPLWDRLHELSMPVLLAVGGRDDRYCDIAREMLPMIGSNADAAVLDSGGHAVHLEHPFAFAVLVIEFVASTLAAADQST